MTDYKVEGLNKRRRELAVEITHLPEQIAARSRDLETLDDALRVVAPDLDVQPLAPKLWKPPDIGANVAR